MYQCQGKYGLAESDAAQALVGRRRVLGPEHPYTMRPWSTMDQSYWRGGRRTVISFYWPERTTVGTIFSLSVGLSPFVETEPTSGVAGFPPQPCGFTNPYRSRIAFAPQVGHTYLL